MAEPFDAETLRLAARFDEIEVALVAEHRSVVDRSVVFDRLADETGLTAAALAALLEPIFDAQADGWRLDPETGWWFSPDDD